MKQTTEIIGILNITPDSFSDGGQAFAVDAALTHAEKLLLDGADIVDVGAESTRPNATPLDAAQEWQRLVEILPQLIHMAHAHQKRISLDSRHAENAEKALVMGVDILNDVNGLRDEAMLRVLAQNQCDVIFMHSLTIPADPNVTLEATVNPIQELLAFFIQTQKKALAIGIQPHRLIMDAGIGFNKTARQSIEIIRRIDELRSTGLRLCVGHSRKSFFNQYTPTPLPANQRDGLTLAVSEFLLTKNIEYLRVHNVLEHVALLKLHQDLYASKA